MPRLSNKHILVVGSLLLITILVGCVPEGGFEDIFNWSEQFFIPHDFQWWNEQLKWVRVIVGFFAAIYVVRGANSDLRNQIMIGPLTVESAALLAQILVMVLGPGLATQVGKRMLGDLTLDAAWLNMAVEPKLDLATPLLGWSTGFIATVAFILGWWAWTVAFVNMILTLMAPLVSSLKTLTLSVLFWIGWGGYMFWLTVSLREIGPAKLGENPSIGTIFDVNSGFVIAGLVLLPTLLLGLPILLLILMPNYELVRHARYGYPTGLARTGRDQDQQSGGKVDVNAVAMAAIGAYVASQGESGPRGYPGMPPAGNGPGGYRPNGGYNGGAPRGPNGYQPRNGGGSGGTQAYLPDPDEGVDRQAAPNANVIDGGQPNWVRPESNSSTNGGVSHTPRHTATNAAASQNGHGSSDDHTQAAEAHDSTSLSNPATSEPMTPPSAPPVREQSTRASKDAFLPDPEEPRSTGQTLPLDPQAQPKRATVSAPAAEPARPSSEPSELLPDPEAT